MLQTSFGAFQVPQSQSASPEQEKTRSGPKALAVKVEPAAAKSENHEALAGYHALFTPNILTMIDGQTGRNQKLVANHCMTDANADQTDAHPLRLQQASAHLDKMKPKLMLAAYQYWILRALLLNLASDNMAAYLASVEIEAQDDAATRTAKQQKQKANQEAILMRLAKMGFLNSPIIDQLFKADNTTAAKHFQNLVPNHPWSCELQYSPADQDLEAQDFGKWIALFDKQAGVGALVAATANGLLIDLATLYASKPTLAKQLLAVHRADIGKREPVKLAVHRADTGKREPVKLITLAIDANDCQTLQQQAGFVTHLATSIASLHPFNQIQEAGTRVQHFLTSCQAGSLQRLTTTRPIAASAAVQAQQRAKTNTKEANTPANQKQGPAAQKRRQLPCRPMTQYQAASCLLGAIEHCYDGWMKTLPSEQQQQLTPYLQQVTELKRFCLSLQTNDKFVQLLNESINVTLTRSIKQCSALANRFEEVLQQTADLSAASKASHAFGAAP